MAKDKKQRQAPQNAALTLQGRRMTVLVDLGADLGPSSSGRSQLVANSHGLHEIPGMEGSGYWWSLLVVKGKPKLAKTSQAAQDETLGGAGPSGRAGA